MKKIKWKHRQWSDMCLICVPTEKKKKQKHLKMKKTTWNLIEENFLKIKIWMFSKKSTYFRDGIYGPEWLSENIFWWNYWI